MKRHRSSSLPSTPPDSARSARSISPPVVLTIAGSDSSGGAGIQTDLKTFTTLGCYGTTVITCLTAQNPARVSSVQPAHLKLVREQMQRIEEAFPLKAAKTGMLWSSSVIRAVAQQWKGPWQQVPLVIDPVMVSTSGHVLLQSSAIETFKKELFPLAQLITPNREEAALLLSRPLTSLAHVRSAAQELSARFGVAFLVKGGHLRGPEAIDILCRDGQNLEEFSAPRVANAHLHGTGCTLSAAITASLALGFELSAAVQAGKEFITRSIVRRFQPGSEPILNPLP